MQEVQVKDKTILNSIEKAREMGKLRNSITGGEGNVAGFIGEFLVHDIIGGEIDNTYEYDIVLPDGTKVDVKTTRTSVTPKEDYECNVSGINTRQDTDMYVFVRVVSGTYEKGWVLGYMPKQEFFEKAMFNKKGTKREGSSFVYKSDTYSMMIKDLKPIEELASEDVGC
jgi:hypothetical protein